MADEAYVAKLPECDIHRHELGTPGVTATFDGRTHRGQWANMCATCFPVYGVGLGTGKGQRLVVGEKPKPRITEAMLNSLSLADLEDLVGDGDPSEWF